MTTFHLSLNVTDLARSVAFYEQFFGRPPAKRHHDYAKFELDTPPLVLSLKTTCIPDRAPVASSTTSVPPISTCTVPASA